MRARAGEREVADRRDPGAEALGRAEPRDRLHVGALEPALALDVRRDPGAEREPVAEAGVDGVLEVRVRVDEARDDRRVREALALAELAGRARPPRSRRPRSRRAPFSIGSPSTGSTQSAERTLTRPPSATSASAMSQRFSMNAASQIESSKRMSSGTTSSASETGSTVGRSTAKTSIKRDADAPVAPQPVGREDAQADEREDEDRHLEGEPAREQRHGDEREVVARPDLDLEELLVEGGQELERARQHDEVGERDPGGEEDGREAWRRPRRSAASCSSIAGARNAQSW